MAAGDRLTSLEADLLDLPAHVDGEVLTAKAVLDAGDVGCHVADGGKPNLAEDEHQGRLGQLQGRQGSFWGHLTPHLTLDIALYRVIGGVATAK